MLNQLAMCVFLWKHVLIIYLVLILNSLKIFFYWILNRFKIEVVCCDPNYVTTINIFLKKSKHLNMKTSTKS